MSAKNKYILCTIIAVILSQGKSYAQQYQTTVDIRVPFVPSPTVINGKPCIYYELNIANFAKDSLRLKTLEVLNATDSSTIFNVDEPRLKSRVKRLAISPKENNLILPPGSFAVVYLEFNLPSKNTGLHFVHRLEFDLLNGSKTTRVSIKGASISIGAEAPLIIGPPLNGGPWAAIYEPSWLTGHRRVFYTIDGTGRLPGRFAIDFIKLDNNGQYAAHNADTIRNWYGYGNDVLAVSDGVVASVRNNFPESSTLSGYQSPPVENATGNYISIKIGNNQFVFYEHLKPGSIKVKPGQKVKRGEVIASLGFTGQTTGPHLHLHIATKDSPLGAEGIPFEFEHFKLSGSYPDLSTFGKKLWMPLVKPAWVSKERPAPNSVVVFDKSSKQISSH
ncbi:M23 family metallopeptidase [Mucilaginibacter sp. SG564]|uniref:M23 family metallopeptidase n=1 Tax=Mucilaginibacter sp. SG564 TaxID=2587022 RepID=UPI001555FDA1|nr:M23 family metallopeptidase [Mucilaginibacter sp. SG564]NOW94804.1 murein DD-endopeptidase MepM/ murein hydrolase activator NlpD [Mucilaginibacter sp. SG564]